MQNGDLQAYEQPTMILVLEGVLADIVSDDPEPKRSLFGRKKPKDDRQFDFHWLEVPVKRTWFLKQSFPDISIEVVTFISEQVAERAANFLTNTVHTPVSSCAYFDFEEFCFGLKFRNEVHSVYDSDSERLMYFGQKGYSVVKGRDWG